MSVVKVEMTYEDFQETLSDAWAEFFSILEDKGLDYEKVYRALDNKDCFNDVFDAVISCVKLESEDE